MEELQAQVLSAGMLATMVTDWTVASPGVAVQRHNAVQGDGAAATAGPRVCHCLGVRSGLRTTLAISELNSAIALLSRSIKENKSNNNNKHISEGEEGGNGQG